MALLRRGGKSASLATPAANAGARGKRAWFSLRRYPGQPVIGYLPRGLSPARDRSGSARPGCRTDPAIAYDRKRAEPRRNCRGAKGIARNHSCIVGKAGCRSNPTAVRRGTLRREIIRRFQPRLGVANGVLGSVVEDEIAKVRVGIQATKISVAKIHQQLVCALLITGVLAVIGFPDRVGKRIIKVRPRILAPSQTPVADRGR